MSKLYEGNSRKRESKGKYESYGEEERGEMGRKITNDRKRQKKVLKRTPKE